MKIGPHIDVTPEMLEAGYSALPYGNLTEEIWDINLAQVYRAMRALEPGPHQDGPSREFIPPTMGVRRV